MSAWHSITPKIWKWKRIKLFYPPIKRRFKFAQRLPSYVVFSMKMATVRTSCCNKAALEFPRTAVLCAPYISHDKQQLYPHTTQRLVVPIQSLYVMYKQSNSCTDLDRPRGFQEAEAPRFADIRHMKVVRSSSYAPTAFSPMEIFLLLVSVRGWVDPRTIVRPEWKLHWNIPMTISGIKPRRSRLQCSVHVM
jgi:hypothetical protein